MKRIIPCLLIILAFAKSENASVEYYESLIQEFMQNNSNWEHPTDSRKFFQASNEEPIFYNNYDFIIVGAGVAGSVLANRLTESGRFKVLVLEAGGQENDYTDVTGFAMTLSRSDYNWGYRTVPQKKGCLSQCNYPRGKAVGGSSVINFAIYVRGNKEDFDKWGSKNPGWNYKSVLPYFKKSENSTLELEEPEYHGHRGPLSVENVKYRPDALNTFLEGIQQNGKKVLDYNGKNQLGYSPAQIMTKNGKRCSANKAFIKPATTRSNLEILDYSLAVKIVIKNKKASGVEFINNGKKYVATVSKEVIISAGATNSPQILMLSGIGPKKHLEELGIPLMKNLPVGENLDDHVIFPGLLFSTNMSVNDPPLQEHIKDFLDGFGFLTAVSGITGIGFAGPKILSRNPSVEHAFFSGLAEQASAFLVDFLEITQENFESLIEPVKGKYVWGLIPVLLHPNSRGTIKLKSKDPLEFPLIDSNVYGDKRNKDMKEMLGIIKDILKISNAPALQSVGSKYAAGSLPACAKFKNPSDDYWRCAMQQITYPILHAVASCKMGPVFDKTAVVNNKLKVYGIDSLRVADASVMPFSISSHPTPTVYMIGEKAADYIRMEHGDIDSFVE